MKKITVEYVGKLELSRIKTTLIYNRFDLWQENVEWKIIKVSQQENEEAKYLQVKLDNKICEIGCWGMELQQGELDAILKFFWKLGVIKVKINRARITDNEEFNNVNDFVVPISKKSNEIDSLLTKKERYNMRRQTKQCEEICGNLSFTDYVIGETPEKSIFKLIQVFWNYKNVSYGSDYAMTEQEYIKKYHVTDIYELKFGNTIAAVLLSCEQGTDVFLENFSFDNKLSKQSPGMIIYNLYLKVLAKKQKEHLFLGGGVRTYIRQSMAV